MPLHVLVDGTDLRDGVDEVPYDIHDRAARHDAGAAPADWSRPTGRRWPTASGDGVVAVHISAALSSTFSSAVQAARGVRLRRCAW